MAPATQNTTSPAPSPIHETGRHRTPELHHSLRHDSSVIALVVGNDNIYAGTQDGEIVVWALATYQQTYRVQAHKRSVLCLSLSDNGTMLFSTAASDPIVNIWCPRTMHRLYEIYSINDSFGDIFSVAYSPQHETVYYGAQNTSIQWVGLKDEHCHVPHDSANHPDRRNHRFFDSRSVGGGASTPRQTDDRFDLIPRSEHVLETGRRANMMYAHYGFVYCMLMARGVTQFADADEDILISGGGDGSIKAWKLGGQEVGPDGIETGLHEIMTLGEDDAVSVLSLAVDGSFLYSGKLNGIFELWDLDTKQKLRSIKAHDGDIWTLQMGWGYLWSAGANGTASKHSIVYYGGYQNDSSQNASQKYQCLTQWRAHDGKILSSALANYNGHQFYITGANDDSINVWMLESQATTEQPSHEEHEDMMITSLREFVSFKTVSSLPEYAEDCRRGASFLRTLFKKLGGEAELLSAEDKVHHPVVFAKFTGKSEPSKRKRVLFYGHYDVVPADTKNGKWDTDPFQLKGTNGYLYGRGVSDNKGPVMAALYAVTDLVQAKSLDSDIVFLIEGQEESGSNGFKETVRKYKARIGHIDYILLANSYWLNDATPCLTYGLRGVMHATVCVESKNPDLHSGVDGSYMINEPMSDLMSVLTKLKGPKNRVMLPGFYDGIPQMTAEEEARYADILSVLTEQSNGDTSRDALKRSLMARWREPNLTHHNVSVSGSEGSLISSHASAKISVRLVPGQEVDDVEMSLVKFVKEVFEDLGSDNRLTVQIDNKAEPWLGDPDNYIFRTLEDAIVKVWAPLFDGEVGGGGLGIGTGYGYGRGGSFSSHRNGVYGAGAHGTNTNNNGNTTTNGASKPKQKKPKLTKPLYIREGGSIPAIRFLEKEFDAPAAHLPCGQASDSAHLDNERLRVENLLKSREIFGIVFKRL